MEEALIGIPYRRIIVEHTRARTFIFSSKGYLRSIQYSLVIGGPFRALFHIFEVHLEYLVAPEDGIEGILHGVRTCALFIPFIAVVSKEVIDCGVGNRFIFHEVAVHSAQSGASGDRQTSAESLPRIGIRDIVSTRHGDRIESTSRLIVGKEGVRYIASGIGCHASSGSPRDKLLVELGHRALAVILGKMAAIHVYISVGVDSSSVARHIIGEDTVLDDDRNVVRRRVGGIRQRG